MKINVVRFKKKKKTTKKPKTDFVHLFKEAEKLL